MKKFLKVTALSATACALLGTSTISAANEGTGQTTVTYEPGVVSPTGADWAVTYPVNVTLNSTHEATEVSEIYSKGETLTFTIRDNGTENHTSNDIVTVTLVGGTDTTGDIKMTVTGTDSNVADAPTMALAKSDSELVKSTTANTDVEVGTLTNSDDAAKNTFTLKAGITDAGEMASNSKASTVLIFKFKSNS